MDVQRPADCWHGVGDPAPDVPGRSETVPAAPSLAALFAAMVCCT